MIKYITYNLLVNNSSEEFYSDLSAFTDTVLKEANSVFNNCLDDYYTHVSQTQPEIPRSKEEYLLELVMTGVLWHNYILKAEKTAYLSKVVLKKLYHVRKNNASLKPITDKVRGYLAYELLNSEKSGVIESFSLHSFQNLLEWLTATGEFTEEVTRLQQWSAFYATKTEAEVSDILRTVVFFSSIFEKLGKEKIGKYTTNVSSFISNTLHEYTHREDYFLAGRKENEYFLNMFGAEIMNRQLREVFYNTSEKAVLLPTCMRSEPEGKCKAASDGKELVCARCNKDCNIGAISTSLREKGVSTYLIPHSSEFSRFLTKWKNNKETGLIGVACVLNLLRGGYEMKRLNIASQCVFLNYCGCKKHWDKDGITTNVSINRLLEIVTPPLSKEDAVITC